MVYCARDASFDVNRPWLVPTIIERRRDARWVEVSVGRSIAKTRCPVGVADRGHTVLVRVKDRGGPVPHQANVRLIGPLAQPDLATRATGCLAVGRPTPVKVETVHAVGAITGRAIDGTRVRLLRTFAVRPAVGEWYAAYASTVSGEASRSGPLLEMISTALPSDPS